MIEPVASGNIYLVGFMAVGKSSIGAQLEKRLGLSFLDLDKEVERRTGETPSLIITQRGEPEFRRLEKETLSALAAREDLIVALGGGAFEDPDSRALLLGRGRVIWLEAGMDFLAGRLKGHIRDSRPLAKNSTNEELRALLEKRSRNYRQAHWTVSVENRSLEDITEDILSKISGGPLEQS